MAEPKKVYSFKDVDCAIGRPFSFEIDAAWRRDVYIREKALQQLSAPFIAQGYRITELEQRVKGGAVDFGKLIDVQIRMPRDPFILWCRRCWRKAFPYMPQVFLERRGISPQK
jgi:hypothetical protein